MLLCLKPRIVIFVDMRGVVEDAFPDIDQLEHGKRFAHGGAMLLSGASAQNALHAATVAVPTIPTAIVGRLRIHVGAA